MSIQYEIQKFRQWMELKIRRHIHAHIPSINEGEIWWAAVGKNIGVEINGKHDTFARPVLIYKKLSRLGFLAIPLTTQPHTGSWYIPFVFRGKTSFAVLSQVKAMSVYRLYERMGRLPETDYQAVKDGFIELYTK